MELSASKVSTGAFATHRRATSQSHGVTCSLSKSVLHCKSCPTVPQNKLQQIGNGCLSNAKVFLSDERLWGIHEKATNVVVSQRSSLICQSTRSPRTKGKERSQTSRGIMSLDARARKDVAIIGSEFLKLDARAREDTMKIDSDVKMKAERLRHITTILKDRAQSKLEKAAAKHWSDGALKDDLRRADFRAKQRAMEDALMALEFVQNIHDMMVSKISLSQQNDPLMADRMMGLITLEKNGRTSDIFPGEVSSDRIAAIQDAYFSMASALSEADGIDYSDPEELELLITTLIDLDAMDGKTSVTLLAECSSSPDESTRKALANALAAAPSMWALGNAGMGALQRLAEDKNPAIAAAASNTIYELKKQWEIEEGDNWRFMVNLKPEEYEGDIPEGDDSS
ncbi:Senescence-associated protein AAF, chlorolplastic [Linum perenne]